MQALQDEFAPRQREIVAQQKDLKAKDEKLQRDGAVMAENERRNAEKDLRDGQRELARKQNEYVEDLNLRRNEEIGKLQRSLLQEVQAYARASSYDLVVSDGVLYVERVASTSPAGAERAAGALQGRRRRAPKPATPKPATPPPPRPSSDASSQGRRSGRSAMSTASLGELAVRFGCDAPGRSRPARRRTSRRWSARTPQALTFLANPRYRTLPAQTQGRRRRAATRSSPAECPVAALIAQNPYADLRAHRGAAASAAAVRRRAASRRAVVDPTAQ